MSEICSCIKLPVGLIFHISRYFHTVTCKMSRGNRLFRNYIEAFYRYQLFPKELKPLHDALLRQAGQTYATVSEKRFTDYSFFFFFRVNYRFL